jgi:hypothetical protein
MEVIVALLGLVGIVAVVALSAMWRGYVLSVLWGWFAVPLGLPVVGVVQAMGVALLVGLLTYRSITTAKLEQSAQEKWTDAIASAITTPSVALGVGWCIKQFL